MGVRKTIGRTASQEVSKVINGKHITLYRRDTFHQNKSALYTTMKKIVAGKLEVDKNFNIFWVETDGTLTGMANV